MAKKSFLTAYLSVLAVVFASPAHAYLDPGTGSMILQGLLGALAAGAAVIGIYWQKVKSFFGRSGMPASSTESVPDDRD